MQIAPEVAEAIAAGRPVVALESTLISHGLPRPRNLDVAREVEAAVRAGGAVPATVAVVSGRACIGLDEMGLEAIAAGETVAKCGVRDLAPVAARGGHGATTVAATAHLAARAGIRLFATGGLGGVHRGARETWDESADLETLARTRIAVVCSGVKSILDVGRHARAARDARCGRARLRDRQLPRLLPRRLRPSRAVAGRLRRRRSRCVLAAQAELGTEGRGLVVANPLPAAEALDRGSCTTACWPTGLEAARRERADGQGRDPVPARLLPPRDGRGQPGGERPPGGSQRPARGRDRGGAHA